MTNHHGRHHDPLESAYEGYKADHSTDIAFKSHSWLAGRKSNVVLHPGVARSTCRWSFPRIRHI